MRWVGVLVLLGGVGACGPSIMVETGEGGGSSASDGEVATTGVTATTVATTNATTADTVATTASTMPTTSPVTVGTTTPTGPGDTTLVTETDGPLDFPCAVNGQSCGGGFECCSGACFSLGITGVCSECDDDTDCEFGCTPGSPFTEVPAVCGDGQLGSGCENDQACVAGLECFVVIDTPGLWTVSTCGECGFDAECGAGSLCTPVFDWETMGGHYACVDVGTVPLGGGCLEQGSGDQQCASGQCAPMSFRGALLDTGICSECDEDVDCPGGTCVMPAAFVGDGQLDVTPGFCD